MPQSREGAIMAVEEARRRALRRVVAEAWGEEVAATLMDLVAPHGQELATRQDIHGVLDALSAMDDRWEGRFAAMEERWDGRLSTMEQRWEGRLEAMDERLEGRLAAMDERWEGRLAAMDERLTAMDERWQGRLAAMDERLTAMDERWEGRFASMQEQLTGMEHRLLSALDRRIADAVTLQTRTLVFSQLGALVVIAALAFGLR